MCHELTREPRRPDRPQALPLCPPGPASALKLPLSPPAVCRHRPQHSPCADRPGPACELHGRESHAAGPRQGPPVGTSGPPLLTRWPFPPRCCPGPRATCCCCCREERHRGAPHASASCLCGTPGAPSSQAQRELLWQQEENQINQLALPLTVLSLAVCRYPCRAVFVEETDVPTS